MTDASETPPHAVVTGASSGIGAAIVDRLLREGWQVTGISRSAPPIADPAFTPLPLDLSDTDAIRSAVAWGPSGIFTHWPGNSEVTPAKQVRGPGMAKQVKMPINPLGSASAFTNPVARMALISEAKSSFSPESSRQNVTPQRP